MVITNNIQKQSYNGYGNPDTKLARDVKKGELIKIVNGLYETDINASLYRLAGYIYGPSYISFDYALSFYGLIPERVNVVTSATFNKKKKKKYNTFFGTLIYRDVPKSVYPYAITFVEEEGYSYQIASPEKALCDKLYTLSPIKNIKELEFLLFNDLRIDEEIFKELNRNIFYELNGLYKCTNINMLCKYVKRLDNE